MDDTQKRVAYWVVVALLCIVLAPVVAAAILYFAGPLNGSSQVGSLLLTLIEYPSGPMSIVQRAVIPLLGVVTIPVLWRQQGRFAVALLILLFVGLLATLWVWVQLANVDNAADLWQDSASTRLNGKTFPGAMEAYMKSIAGLIVVDILIIFGLKGAELIFGGKNG